MSSVADPDHIEDLLTELVLLWEESVAAGKPQSAAEICSECPQMTDELERALKRLKSLNQFLVADPRVNRKTGAPPEDVPPSPETPDVPGYELLEELGRGGMGVVYKARQVSLNRMVAIKTLLGSRWSHPDSLVRLRQEAKGLSLLDHPNVVKVLDVVETPHVISLILEYVAGESLSKRLKRSTLAPEDAARLAMQLARVVGFVHQRGLLHRDIKPANILIDDSGQMKIADFGLVKEQGVGDQLTQAGDFIGTPNYVAPEQVPGESDRVDVKTDVYAIGATLYEMISGRPPFVGVSTNDTLNQVQTRDPVPLRVLNPATPRDLETICLKCLEKQPDRRFLTAFELADELERYLNGEPILSRPIGTLERSYRWCRRNRAGAGILFTGCVAALAILMLLISNNRNLTAYNQKLNRLNTDLETTVAQLDLTAKKAQQLQHTAELHEQQAKDALYVSDINRAAIAMQQEDTRELTRLLQQYRPHDGERDRRGFEWWFLHRQASRSGTLLYDASRPQYILKFVPGTTDLVCAGADSIVRLLNSSTGELKREIPTHQLEVNGIAFSPDGLQMATTGDDGTIVIWNLSTGSERIRFKVHPEKAFQAAYTADGTQIVTCGTDPVLRVFDVASGTLAYTLEGHRRTIESIDFASDDTLISTSDDHTIKFWSVKTRQEIGSVEIASDAISFLHHVPRDCVIVGDASGQIQTIHISTQKTIDAIKQLDRIGGMALHPDGIFLAAGDVSGKISLRRLGPEGHFTEDDVQRWQAHRGMVYSLVWSQDGSKLFSAGDDGRIVTWDLASTQSPGITEIPLSKVYDGFSLIPNSTSLILSSSAGVTRVDWKTRQVTKFNEIRGLIGPTFSPNGSYYAGVDVLVAEPRLDQVRVFGVNSNSLSTVTGETIAIWNPGEGTLNRISFSPDSSTIAVSRWVQKQKNEEADHFIHLLNLSTIAKGEDLAGQSPQMIERADRIPIPFARAAQFSPDGKSLAVIARNGLVVWDLSSDHVRWETASSSIYRAAYSADGTMLAIVCNDRLVRVLNATDGSIRFQSTNHRAPIHGIAFSPDSRLLATGSEEGTIKFWHVGLGQELMELKYPGEEVIQLEFTSSTHLICELRSLSDRTAYRMLILDGAKFSPD